MPDLVPFFLTFDSMLRVRIKFIFVLCPRKRTQIKISKGMCVKAREQM